MIIESLILNNVQIFNVFLQFFSMELLIAFTPSNIENFILNQSLKTFQLPTNI